MYPEDPRQLTVEECRAYNDAYMSNQYAMYSDDYTTGTTPEIEEVFPDAPWANREYTQEELNAMAEANGWKLADDVSSERAAEIMDGWEIDWD